MSCSRGQGGQVFFGGGGVEGAPSITHRMSLGRLARCGKGRNPLPCCKGKERYTHIVSDGSSRRLAGM